MGMPSSRSVLLLLVLASASAAQQPWLSTVQGDEVGDAFGAALASTRDVDGDGVRDYIVGAPQAEAGGSNRGKAWVFSGADHSVLHLFVGLQDAGAFGTSVAGAGDLDYDGHEDLVVGQPGPLPVGGGPGHAFVFSGADGSLMFPLEGRMDGDLFGQAVAGLGDLNHDGFPDIAVGAPQHGAGCDSPCRGRVAVFSGLDGSELLAKVGWQPFMALGRNVARYVDHDGDGTLDFLVGAPSFGADGGPHVLGTGAVFVLSGSSADVLVTALGPVFPFGKESAHTGTTLGALGDLDGDGVNDFYGGGSEDLSGSISLFSGVDGSEITELHVYGTDPMAAPLGDLDGDGLHEFLLTDNEADGLAPPRGGNVHARDLAGTRTFMIQRGDVTNTRFGTTMVLAGDADEDGLPEILAGSPGPPFGTPTAPGRVQLFEFRTLDPLSIVEGDAPAPVLGAIVAAAGDVDNDGVTDIVSGEPGDDSVAPDAGRARVLSGRDGRVLHEVFGTSAFGQLGWAVDGAGDIDRDGFADFIVGLPFPPSPSPGVARVYSGKTGALLLDLLGQLTTDRFGASVAGVGDTNGDLVPDVLVGAFGSSVAAPSAGSAYLLSGADGSVLHAIHGSGAAHGLGTHVAGGGDADADGVPDLLVHVPNEPAGFPTLLPGMVHLYSGATGLLLHKFQGEQLPVGQFGAALGDAGDVDGDGHDDIVIGAPSFGPGFFPPGKAYVFSGASGALLWSHGAATHAGNVGQSVAGLGDMDGDGLSDVLVGAPRVNVLQGIEGEARLLSGADGAVLQAYAGRYGTELTGTVVDRAGDFDLDGRSEVLVSATTSPGLPDGEVTLWASGDGIGPWSNLGAVLPGAHGPPALLPAGTLVAGEPVVLTLDGALASAPAALVVGVTLLGAPFKSGTLVPDPILIVAGLVTDPGGALSVASAWPDGLPPGQAIYLQVLVADAAALKGWALSNAVQGTVP